MADSLTRRDVEDIALLARLELDDEEIERVRTDLSDILAHMDALQAVDTTDVEPMTHAVPMHLRLREDVVGPSLPVEEAVAGAAVRQDGFFQVPHIIKKKTARSGE